MSWFDGFPFKSHSQMKREQKEFENRVLPFGMPQKDAALQVLKPLFSQKLPDDQIVFAYLSARDRYEIERDDGPEKQRQAAMATLKNQSWLTPAECEAVLVLVQLDSNITSLEEFPTTEMVQELVAMRLPEEPQKRKK